MDVSRNGVGNHVEGEKGVERIHVVGHDEDGPILSIPDHFVYKPKHAENGMLILPAAWAD